MSAQEPREWFWEPLKLHLTVFLREPSSPANEPRVVSEDSIKPDSAPPRATLSFTRTAQKIAPAVHSQHGYSLAVSLRHHQFASEKERSRAWDCMGLDLSLARCCATFKKKTVSVLVTVIERVVDCARTLQVSARFQSGGSLSILVHSCAPDSSPFSPTAERQDVSFHNVFLLTSYLRF